MLYIFDKAKSFKLCLFYYKIQIGFTSCPISASTTEKKTTKKTAYEQCVIMLENLEKSISQ